MGSLGKRLYHRLLMLLPREQSLQLQYFRSNLSIPNIQSPTTFNEKILRRKLTENDDRYPELADKIRVKHHVATTIGERYVIKTLWSGKTLPADIGDWKRPFVIKANHACGWNIFIKDGDEVDWDAVRRKCSDWMDTEFQPWLGERWYNRIDRRTLVEEFIGDENGPPPDYKFFVFAGVVRLVQVDVARFGDHRRNLYRPDWTLLDAEHHYKPTHGPLAPPTHLDLMMELAAKLGNGFDFVRVDFYDLPDGPKFGEMTFSPATGVIQFQPLALDVELGSCWPD